MHTEMQERFKKGLHIAKESIDSGAALAKA